MKSKVGFTLIELIIVLAIIATLAAILITIIKPQQIFMNMRDTQRKSDLNTLSRAIDIYMADMTQRGLDIVLTPSGTASYFIMTGGEQIANEINFNCVNSPGQGTIFFSSPNASSTIISISELSAYFFYSGLLFEGFLGYDSIRATNSIRIANSTNTNNYGWLPVPLVFSEYINLPRLPIDPINTKSNNVISDNHYYYVFACAKIKNNFVYEINANLEIKNYDEQNDGGSANDLYEVGTDLRILPYKINGYFKYQP